MFACGHRNARYIGIRARFLKVIEEKQEISPQDLGDECVRMESIMSDTTMIQNKTEEYDCVRKIEDFPQKKNSPKQSQKGKPPPRCWLCDDLHFARNCPSRYHICNIRGKKGYKETKCEIGTKAPSMNKLAAKKPRPPKSLSVVSSTYETDRINRRQYVTLTINGQKVRLQIDTASDI